MPKIDNITTGFTSEQVAAITAAVATALASPPPTPALAPETVEPAVERYFTPHRAAEYLDVSASTIYRQISNGTLPHVRVGKRGVRIRRSDLDALVHRRTEVA